MQVKRDGAQNLLLPHEVAAILGVGTNRVRQLEASGVLNALRTAGGWRLFERADVEALAAVRAAKV